MNQNIVVALPQSHQDRIIPLVLPLATQNIPFNPFNPSTQSQLHRFCLQYMSCQLSHIRRDITKDCILSQ
jgi:hypothetical protein